MSQERIVPRDKVLKERMEQKVFPLPHGKGIIANITMQLVNKGLFQEPALHCYASCKRLYGTPPGQADAPPYLEHTEYGAYQLQLIAAIQQRIGTMKAQELERFEKGGYLGIGCIISQTKEHFSRSSQKDVN